MLYAIIPSNPPLTFERSNKPKARNPDEPALKNFRKKLYVRQNRAYAVTKSMVSVPYAVMLAQISETETSTRLIRVV